MKQEIKNKSPKSSGGRPKAIKQPKASSTPVLKIPELEEPEHGFKYVEHLTLAGVLTALIALAALSVFIFNVKGSLAPISVNSIPLQADMPGEQVRQKIQAATENYKLAVEAPGGTKTYFNPGQTGVTIDVDASVNRVKAAVSQAAFSRLVWWKPIKVELVVEVDQAALQAFINTHATQMLSVPKDATLTVDNGVAVVAEEVPGTGYGVKNASGAIQTAIAKLQPTPLKLETVKLSPTITVGNLQTSEKKVEAILSQQVSFSINGQSVQAKATDIAGWVELSPVESEKTVDVTVNSGKVLQYINQIAKPYIHPPRSKLVISSTDGQVVLDYGADGVDVVSKDKVAADVAQQVLKGGGVKVDLPVKFAAASTVEVQPYDKWIVIDTTNKRLYAYEQTSLAKTFLISAGAPQTPTVVGQFSIYSKVRIQDMRGSNADGSRYFQPDVQYVNYFYKDYAIHGNYWRPLSYFGNVNSSHGCVGIVNADAAWLYDWAPVGTRVIVHK